MTRLFFCRVPLASLFSVNLWAFIWFRLYTIWLHEFEPQIMQHATKTREDIHNCNNVNPWSPKKKRQIHDIPRAHHSTTRRTHTYYVSNECLPRVSNPPRTRPVSWKTILTSLLYNRLRRPGPQSLIRGKSSATRRQSVGQSDVYF